MTLYDDKTGRQYPARDYAAAVRIARMKGVTDWTWCPASAPAPATMKETTDAMREARDGR